MTTLKELEEALIEYLNDSAAYMGRDPDSIAYYLKSFIETNSESITDLGISVIPNGLTFCATHQPDTFDLELDSAHSFILGTLDKIALEWHDKWTRGES